MYIRLRKGEADFQYVIYYLPRNESESVENKFQRFSRILPVLHVG